jgi:hypothetical protein
MLSDKDDALREQLVQSPLSSGGRFMLGFIPSFSDADDPETEYGAGPCVCSWQTS